MKSLAKWCAAGIVVLLILYFLGPVPPNPTIDTSLPKTQTDLGLLEQEVNQLERQTVGLKKDNQARIVWADSLLKHRTRFCVVYLHGFSGSQADGYPIHMEFAKRYGCNLYLSRLYGHGIDKEDALKDLTPENYLKSACRAVSIGKTLGEKVIIMATSTGATLALLIASEHPEIAGLVLYSPNIDFRDKASSVLVKPWGLFIARCFQGGYNIESADPENVRAYWQSKYRIEALVTTKSLLSSTMNEATFTKIHQSVFVGYYYKNEEEQDTRVSVSRILEMFDQLSTPSESRRKVAFPNASAHPIACSIVSKDVESVRFQTFAFAEEVLNLVPIDSLSRRYSSR